MTTDSVVLQGTILADGTLHVAGPVLIRPGPIEVEIRPVAVPVKREGVMDVIARIRAAQAARGHVPRSAEEIDASVREMREEWEERDRRIEAIHNTSQHSPNPDAETTS